MQHKAHKTPQNNAPSGTPPRHAQAACPKRHARLLCAVGNGRRVRSLHCLYAFPMFVKLSDPS
eukprot:4557621-Amphidinium_carterae.1